MAAKDGNDYEGLGAKVGNQNDADRQARDDQQKANALQMKADAAAWRAEQAAAKAGKK